MRSIVRPYEERDRRAVRYICCDTGFMGEPMEIFMDGREVFADLWCSYYTDYEPEHTWVAEVDGQVVGYIFGGLDTRRQEKITLSRVIPKLLLKAFITDCAWSPRTRRYVSSVIRSSRRGELKTPNLSREYPAHLHTNILEGYRGKGLGKKMMNEWINHLAGHNVKALHLITTTRNKLAVPFYKHMGFRTLFEAPTTMYDYIIDEPVALFGMGIKL
jgi:GNAT superfamily N-acetyltransferase